jgi:hypothetical protein
MGTWIHCNVEVSHDDPAALERVVRASSPDVRHLFVEFMPTDEDTLSSIKADPEPMPWLVVDARRTVRLRFELKNDAPIDLFDAMVAAGYRVRCQYDDTDWHVYDTWLYEDGEETHVGHHDANAEDDKAMRALEHEVAAAFLAERWTEFGQDYEAFRRRWLANAAARVVEYADALLDTAADLYLKQREPGWYLKEPEPAE